MGPMLDLIQLPGIAAMNSPSGVNALDVLIYVVRGRVGCQRHGLGN